MRGLRILAASATFAAGLTVAGFANANTIVLNFAGLDGFDQEQILNYYNGGTGGLGSGPGTNYGISFGSDALSCDGAPGGSCNTAEIPGGPGAQAMFFLSGPGDVMNVAAGFTTGFSFYYTASGGGGTVDVWSGLNDTGTLLASLVLPATPIDGDPGCFNEPFCPYEAFGVTFAGTAMSVDFSGVANEIGFADVTLGSNVAGGVPEPDSLALLGAAIMGLAGFGAYRRRRTLTA